MASSNDVFCDMCNGNHITKLAEYWCPECEEGFCSDCLKPHSKMKLTKDHEVISIDSYKQLPASIPKLTRHCDDHCKEYQLYCSHHECLCCAVCAVTTHKECKGLLPMDEAIKSSKTSVSLEALESALTNIASNMEKAQTDREINVANLSEQGKKFHDKIKEKRATINSYFDEIEEKLHGELNSVEEKAKSQIQGTLLNIKEKRDRVNMLQQDLLAVKKYGSDIQTFLWSTIHTAEVTKQEKFIETLSQDGSLKHMRLDLEIDTKISDITSNASFGKVTTRLENQTVTLKTDREEQAQIISAVQKVNNHTINDLNFILKSKFSIPTEGKTLEVLGAIISSEGKLIFADEGNNRLVLMNDNGTLFKEIPVTGISDGLHDVTNIDDKTVAVTTYNTIHIINLQSKNVTELIKTDGFCFGIVHQKGDLFWCEESRGIRMYNLSAMYLSTIVGKKSISLWSYIAVYNEKLYVSNMDTYAVTCYSITGEKIWVFKSQSILTPRCITVDSGSNVFVASGQNNKIVIISADGKQCKTLLDMEGISGRLWGIHYDQVKHNLLVSFTGGDAFLYKFN